MNIILNGYLGRMGQMVIAESKAHEQDHIAAMIDPHTDGAEHTYPSLDAYTKQADVVIDFTSHVCTDALLNYCTAHLLPVVICTTGQTEAELNSIQEASTKIPIFYSGNMSLGIAVLTDLVRTAVKMFPDAEVEIVEKHHDQKMDVPSGTALMLAHAVQQERPDATILVGRHENGRRTKQEIGIHSLRMGNETGTHEVYINNGAECLTLTHEANSRAVFAQGAWRAAAYLVNKGPGIYTMQDLMGE